MSQQRLRVPEPEGLGNKRTSSEDNLYLAVLRASEGKKGSWHSFWAGLWCQEVLAQRGWGPCYKGRDLGDRLQGGGQ